MGVDACARPARVAALVLLVVLGAACATRAPQSPTTTVGVASWYGPGFHGRATASGERYDQHGLTAAHRTWPLGTAVRVTHLANGRSLVVRINDRGPFVDGREIDLSFEAARQLGIVRPGTARVRLDPIRTDEAPPRAVRFAVQVGSFLTEPHAAAMRRQVSGLRGVGRAPHRPGPRDVYVATARRADRTMYRVRVGPCSDRDEARGLASELRRAGIDSLVVEEIVALD